MSGGDMVAPVRGSAAGVPMTNLTPADLAALTATREADRHERKARNFRRYARRMRRIDPRWGSRQEGLV